MNESTVTDLQNARPIEPETYQRVLQGLNLQSVCVDRLHTSFERDSVSDGLMDLNVNADMFDRQSDEEYLTFVTYKINGQQDSIALFVMDVTYRLTFKTQDPIPAGFFDVFQEINLPMVPLPFLRELVASTTRRLGMATLTLPFYVFQPPAEGV